MTQDRPGGLAAGNSENDLARDGQLSHVDEKGVVRMVDVSQKADTERQAIAEGWIFMHPDTLAMITDGTAAKGDVLACARVAGIMGCSRRARLSPCAIHLTSPSPSASSSPSWQANAKMDEWAFTRP